MLEGYSSYVNQSKLCTAIHKFGNVFLLFNKTPLVKPPQIMEVTIVGSINTDLMWYAFYDLK